MASQDNPYIVIGDHQLFVSCYILEELRRLPHLGNIFPHLLVVRKALKQGLFNFFKWSCLTYSDTLPAPGTHQTSNVSQHSGQSPQY